jgi:hypothetical protein
VIETIVRGDGGKRHVGTLKALVDAGGRHVAHAREETRIQGDG